LAYLLVGAAYLILSLLLMVSRYVQWWYTFEDMLAVAEVSWRKISVNRRVQYKCR
jgi:hypothetical protein